MYADRVGCDSQAGITWLERGNKLHSSWNNTVLGRLLINDKRLRVEVNSDSRAARIREIIEARPGSKARYRVTERQSLEKMLSEASEARGSGGDRESALLLAEHYESWPDVTLAALSGKTPREACRTKRGRERVAALVDGIECNSTEEPGFDPAIIERLRAELRL